MRSKLLVTVIATVGLIVVPATAQAFTVYSENFETFNDTVGGPSLVNTSAAGTASWGVTCNNGLAHSGNCYGRVASLGANQDTRFTQAIPVQAHGQVNNVQLNFWLNFDTDIVGAPAGTAFDGLRLETSTNGGPWVDFLTRPGASILLNGYNKTINGGTVLPVGTRVWGGLSNGWRHSIVNLGSLSGKTDQLRFRFRWVSDSVVTSTFVRIDDIFETSNDGVTTPDPAPVQPGEGKQRG
jgi:hypothetical protein